MAAEAVISANLRWSLENRSFDLFGDCIPLSLVESWARLDSRDALLVVLEQNAALGLGERQMQPIRLFGAIRILTWPPNSFLQQNSKLVRIERFPIWTQQICFHFGFLFGHRSTP